MGLWLDRNSDENMGMHVDKWGRSEKRNLNWKEFMRNLLGPWGVPFQISFSLSLLFFAFSGEIHQLSCIFVALRFNWLALPMFMQHLGLVQATRFLLYRSL